MKIRSQAAATLSKLIVSIAAAFGVLKVCGVFAGAADFSQLRYYAVFANALAAVFYFICFVRGLFVNRELLPKFRGAVILLLAVSVFMDAAKLTGEGSTAFSYLLLHDIVPILTVLDWLLFGEKGHYRWIAPVLWLILPNLYFIYVFVRVKLFSRGWLYGFLNTGVRGGWPVLLTVLTLDAFALALGYLFASIDHLTVEHKRKRKSRR